MKFYNSYIELGEQFFDRSKPEKVPEPTLLLWNNELANDLSISQSLQNNVELLRHYCTGNEFPDGITPIALAYSGHQFGSFNPNLGDGRAHLLGEMIDKNGKRQDVQLKGSGQTAYSRRGDGKCALGPAIREFLMSEALYAVGVPTSRCLAVGSTGEIINRGLAKAGAVVTRVASSHIRVGSFQHFAARGDIQSLKILLNYTIERHFPEINSKNLTEEDRVLQFLECAIEKQITLITQWLRIGFIHGVMNTDNTAISGETIDFGPCAMLGLYDENAVYSSIDENGRYAFGNQGKIAHWNMARLADCLLLLLNKISEDKSDDEDEVNELKDQLFEKTEAVIHQYNHKYHQAYYQMFANKIGLSNYNEDSILLINDLLSLMKTNKLDYTQTFYSLTKSLTVDKKQYEIVSELECWYSSWLEHLNQTEQSLEAALTLMLNNNPVVIPRNHHVEAILERCELVVMSNLQNKTGQNKYVVAEIVEEFLKVLRSPYKEITATKNYQDTPTDNDRYYQTFCGT